MLKSIQYLNIVLKVSVDSAMAEYQLIYLHINSNYLFYNSDIFFQQ